MAQHFLLSAKARTLSIREIYEGGNDNAYETFKRLRWPATDGEPVCPHCGSLAHYTTARRRFACKDCRKQYSVTSGTIFASRKMAFVDLLAAICIVTNGAKGISAALGSKCTTGPPNNLGLRPSYNTPLMSTCRCIGGGHERQERN